MATWTLSGNVPASSYTGRRVNLSSPLFSGEVLEIVAGQDSKWFVLDFSTASLVSSDGTTLSGALRLEGSFTPAKRQWVFDVRLNSSQVYLLYKFFASQQAAYKSLAFVNGVTLQDYFDPVLQIPGFSSPALLGGTSQVFDSTAGFAAYNVLLGQPRSTWLGSDRWDVSFEAEEY